MERLERDPSDPAYVPNSPGMNADQAKAFAAMAGVLAAPKQEDPKVAMAKVIASQTGKTLEEVLAFMGGATPVAATPAPATPQVLEEQPILRS